MAEWIKDWWPLVFAVVGGIWAAYTYFDKRRAEKQKLARDTMSAEHAMVTASNGSVAAGRDMTDNSIATNASSDPTRP